MVPVLNILGFFVLVPFNKNFTCEKREERGVEVTAIQRMEILYSPLLAIIFIVFKGKEGRCWVHYSLDRFYSVKG